MIRTQQPHGQQQEPHGQQQHETMRHNAKQRETNETTIQRDSNKNGQVDDDGRRTTTKKKTMTPHHRQQ